MVNRLSDCLENYRLPGCESVADPRQRSKPPSEENPSFEKLQHQ